MFKEGIDPCPVNPPEFFLEPVAEEGMVDQSFRQVVVCTEAVDFVSRCDFIDSYHRPEFLEIRARNAKFGVPARVESLSQGED